MVARQASTLPMKPFPQDGFCSFMDNSLGLILFLVLLLSAAVGCYIALFETGSVSGVAQVGLGITM